MPSADSSGDDRGGCRGAGIAGHAQPQELLHQPHARAAVRAAQSHLAQRLVLDRADALLGDQQRHREVARGRRRRRRVQPVGLARRIHRRIEFQPPAAEIERARPDADAARPGAGAYHIAVVRRTGGTDDVDGFQPQRLAGDGGGLVAVRLQRHPPLLADDGAVLPCGIERDPRKIGCHVSILRAFLGRLCCARLPVSWSAQAGHVFPAPREAQTWVAGLRRP